TGRGHGGARLLASVEEAALLVERAKRVYDVEVHTVLRGGAAHLEERGGGGLLHVLAVDRREARADRSAGVVRGRGAARRGLELVGIDRRRVRERGRVVGLALVAAEGGA